MHQIPAIRPKLVRMVVHRDANALQHGCTTYVLVQSVAKKALLSVVSTHQYSKVSRISPSLGPFNVQQFLFSPGREKSLQSRFS